MQADTQCMLFLITMLACAAACSAFRGLPALPAQPTCVYAPQHARRRLQMSMSTPDLGDDGLHLRQKPQAPGAAPPPSRSATADAQALDTRVMRLERRIIVLNALVEDVCSALLHCDDVALMERHARSMGDIYLDTGFTTTRRPRMVRQELVQIMNRHNVTDKPLMYTWKNTRFPMQRRIDDGGFGVVV